MNSQKFLLILLVGIIAIPYGTFASATQPEWMVWIWDTPENELGQNVWGVGNHLYISGLATTSIDDDSYTSYLLMKWTTSGFVVWHTTGSNEMNTTLSIWADEDYMYFTGFTDTFNIRKYQYPTNRDHSYGFFSDQRDFYDLMGINNYYYAVGSINESSNMDLTLVKCYDLYEGVSTHPDSRGLWAYEFDENKDEIGYDVWVDDTGIYTLGCSEDDLGNQKMLLLQWYFSGGMKWKREWSIPSYNVVGKSVIAKDESLYTLGTKRLNNTSDSDLILIGWDNDGNELWNTTWGGSESEIAESMWMLENSIYCVGHTEGRVFMIEFNQTGGFVENHAIPELNHHGDYNNMWGDESSLYVTGYRNATNGDTSLTVLKFTPTGTTEKIPGYSSAIVLSVIGIGLLLITIQVKRKLKKW